MSDDKYRSALHQAVHTAFDEKLGTGINGARRFIKDEYDRVADRRACNRNKLTLPLRKVRAVGFEHGIVALGKMRDEVVRVCNLCSFDAVIVARIKPAVTDILHDSTREKVRILKHHAERTPEVTLFDAAHIYAVIGYLARVHIVETIDKIGDSGLARAGRTDKGDLLPALCIERYIMKHGLFAVVAEIHIMKLNLADERNIGEASVCARYAPELFSVLTFDEDYIAIVELGFNIHELEYPLGACERQQYEVELLRDLRDPVRKLPDVAKEGNKHAARGYKPEYAEGTGDGVEDMGEVIHDRADDV